MGKGRIVSELGEGRYQVEIIYNTDRIDARIDTLERLLADPDKELARLNAELLLIEEQNTLNAILADLDDIISDIRFSANWQSNTAYSIGDWVKITPFAVAEAQTASVSGDAPPTWPADGGGTVVENFVVWSTFDSAVPIDGAGFWSSNRNYDLADTINTTESFSPGTTRYARVTTPGRSGNSEPNWTGNTIQEGGLLWRRIDMSDRIKELSGKAAEQRVVVANARQQRNALFAEKQAQALELNRLKNYKPPERIESLWCADYSEGLSGEVALYEVPDEYRQQPPNIKPANAQSDGAVWEQSDGVLEPIMAMSPEAAYFNAAMLAGAQKWRPGFRTATISNINIVADTATITLDAAKSSAQNINVNEQTSYSGVPVRYMTCNAAAFSDNDKVLVKFEDRDRTKPVVIGFVSQPKLCLQPAIFLYFLPRLSDSSGLVGTGSYVRPLNWSALVNPDDLAAYIEKTEDDGYVFGGPNTEVERPSFGYMDVRLNENDLTNLIDENDQPTIEITTTSGHVGTYPRVSARKNYFPLGDSYFPDADTLNYGNFTHDGATSETDVLKPVNSVHGAYNSAYPVRSSDNPTAYCDLETVIVDDTITSQRSGTPKTYELFVDPQNGQTQSVEICPLDPALYDNSATLNWTITYIPGPVGASAVLADFPNLTVERNGQTLTYTPTAMHFYRPTGGAGYYRLTLELE